MTQITVKNDYPKQINRGMATIEEKSSIVAIFYISVYLYIIR